jgi:ABC-type Fe3+ transport system permease subunit
VSRDRLIPILQAVPTWLILGLLLLAPLGALVADSVRPPTEDELVADEVVVGEAQSHFRAAVRPAAWRVYWRSCWVSTLTTGVTLLIGYPVAYYIALVAPPKRRGLLLIAVAPTWPVAFALAAADSGAAPHDVLVSYAAGWAENMTQAALKSVPLGQAAAARVLAALFAAIPHAVERAQEIAADEMQAFAPMLAILSAQHEVQYSRLFRS